MCRLLAQLTNTDQRIMSETIKRLEHKTGSPAVDIRLTSDIHSQIHQKIRALGLDPHDTTPKELFVGLQNLAAVHDKFLKKKFQLDQSVSSDNFARDVCFVYERLRFNRRSWLLRPSVIKKILRQYPPKTLVKVLGYRSVDSLIKREPADVVMFLAGYVESDSWQLQLAKQLRTISSADFEERLLEVRTLDEPRYKDVSSRLVAKKRTFVFSTPLLGTVFILPPTGSVRPGMLLLAVLMALREATELQQAHSQLRHYQMDSSFNQKITDAFHGRSPKSVTVAGHSFNWRLIHRHYGSSPNVHHPMIFQPHLQAEDLAYRRAEEILYHVEPALHFWHGLEYVGLPTEAGIVSFNLLDVLIGLVNGSSLTGRYDTHLPMAVWDELLLRYMSQPAVEHAVLSGLAAQDEHSVHAVHDMEFV